MYRIGVEALLGLKIEGDTLRIAPSIPARWPGFTATMTRPGGMRLLIDVQNPDGVMHGVREVWLDDTRIDGDLVRLPSEGEHRVRVVMGAQPQAPTPAPAAVH